MKPRHLAPILYTIFLIMFITTFVVAIGALLEIWPFDKVEAKYRDRLFWLLIAEIALIGIDLFRNMQPAEILRYEITVAYSHYSDALKNALSKEQKDAWDRYSQGEIGNKLTRLEQTVISEIKAAEINDGQHARGEVYLNLDRTRNLLEGSFNYRFPHDQYFSHMPVVGKRSRKEMELTLFQPERFFWDGDAVNIRPAVNYSLVLKPNAEGRSLTGTLAYPSPRIKSNVIMATVTCIEKD